MNNKKIVVGMSGGVDSSMSLYLLKKQGFEPIGISLKYDVWDDPSNTIKENVCCNAESFEIARHVCEKLEVPYAIIDCSKEFDREVVDYVKKELKDSHTPNPCIICNRKLKFKELFDYADKNDIKFVATGHYARIKDGKLMKGIDPTKDQTYSLSFLKKEDLSRIIFPLGDYLKEDILKMAGDVGFKFYQYRKQSQDWCYVSDKAYQSFLEKVIGVKKGSILDTSGKKIGEHKGLHFYTIGQRKGLPLENGPFFVVDLNIDKNELIVSKMGTYPELFKTEITLSPFNLFIATPKKHLKVQAKIRYKQELESATLYKPEKDSIKLKFDSPIRAVTKGQFAVFYDGDIVIGAGRII
ncbi:MAG: tRNA 2-thiouridine(34) synthase MnmA [Candidatus Gracilibacteria bacterium]|jgi:tRNA-specific 2-thiouridylase